MVPRSTTRPAVLAALAATLAVVAPPRAAAAPGDHPVVISRMQAGLVLGPSYRVHDLLGHDDGGAGTAGLELSLQLGRPHLAFETQIGFHATRVQSDHYGPEPRTLTFVPWLVGFATSLALSRGGAAEARLDLGIDGGFLFRVGCRDCAAESLSPLGLAVQVRAGVDTYFGRRRANGVGVDLVLMVGREGDVNDAIAPSGLEVVPPTALLRVSLLVRNTSLPW